MMEYSADDIRPIMDYDFKTGERAQFLYINSEKAESSLMVRVLDEAWYPDGKWYIVEAHRKPIETAGVTISEFHTEFFAEMMPTNHAAFLVDPDELEPAYRSLTLVVDNT